MNHCHFIHICFSSSTVRFAIYQTQSIFNEPKKKEKKKQIIKICYIFSDVHNKRKHKNVIILELFDKENKINRGVAKCYKQICLTKCDRANRLGALDFYFGPRERNASESK